MIGLIGAVLAIGISLLWYLPGIRAQGENRVLTRKDYWRSAGVYGFCFTSLLIIVTEILWDSIADRVGLSGLARDIIADFFARGAAGGVLQVHRLPAGEALAEAPEKD